jgi:hypothetical protein
VFRSSELRYLPRDVQNAIEAARIEADREFMEATSDPTISGRKVLELRKKWLFRIVLGFTQAACEEISQGKRGLAQVAGWRNEIFNDAAICAGFEIHRPEVRDELCRSAEWGRSERLLGNAAKGATEHENPAPESNIRREPLRRMPSTVYSPDAARKLEKYMHDNGGQAAFAIKVHITERTLRSLRKSGKARRTTFEAIAAGMETTIDKLLKPLEP